MAQQYGYFHPVGHPEKIVPFQKLELRHLPGTPLMCPCWLTWVLSIAALLIPRCYSVTLRKWLKHPRIWWIKIPQYLLLKSIAFTDARGNTWEVFGADRGVCFIFNGGSIPWFLWWLCPPDHPDCIAGFCVHDMLCTSPYPCDYIEASRVLYEAVLTNGYYRWGSWRNWKAVLWFGPRFEKTEVD